MPDVFVMFEILKRCLAANVVVFKGEYDFETNDIVFRVFNGYVDWWS